MTSAAKFNAELRQWFDVNAIKKPLQAQRIAIIEAITQAVQATPVGNEKNWKINANRIDETGKRRKGMKLYRRPNYVGGHARRNWQVNFGSPLRQVLDGTDRSGVSSIRAGVGVARSLTQLGKTYITNNVSYIGVIDQGKPGTNPLYKPWSKQAPEGLLEPILRGVLQRLTETDFKRGLP